MCMYKIIVPRPKTVLKSSSSMIGLVYDDVMVFMIIIEHRFIIINIYLSS